MLWASFVAACIVAACSLNALISYNPVNKTHGCQLYFKMDCAVVPNFGKDAVSESLQPHNFTKLHTIVTLPASSV